MQAMRLCFLTAATCLAHSGASAVKNGELARAMDGSTATALDKVIKLLIGLRTDIETEGKTEAATYAEYSCFCRAKTDGLAEGIMQKQDTIDGFAADMDEMAADIATAKTGLKGLAAKLAELTTDMKDADANCRAEEQKYTVKDADHTRALNALADAMRQLKASKAAPEASAPEAPEAPKLLEMRKAVKDSLDLAQAMKLLDDGPVWKTAAAFLQEGASVDPKDAGYKFHSDGIMSLMQKLANEFAMKKEETDDEWKKTQKSCSRLMSALAQAVMGIQGTTGQVEMLKSMLEGQFGEIRSEMVTYESLLKDDAMFLKDLTESCQQRAKQWDQRATARKGELDAIGKVLIILLQKVTAANTAVNARSLLLAQRGSRPPAGRAPEAGGRPLEAALAADAEASGKDLAVSFLQGRAEVVQRSRALAGDSSAALAQQRRQRRALEVLATEGRRLGSSALSGLALRAADDPFVKVKTMIQKLVERLLDEAASEATKKGFCDEELGTTRQERSFKFETVEKLSSEIGVMEAKKESLEVEIKDLIESIDKLTASLNEATRVRKEEKEENEKDIETSKKGLTAITMAHQVLQTYYREAAKATDKGSYQGKQSSSGAIIGMLDVIKSDFKRTLRTLIKDEKEAAADFVKLERSLVVSLEGKQRKLEIDREELSSTETNMEAKLLEMKKNMDLVDKAMLALLELKPMCIDSGMSYEERVQKREEEVQAMKRALCILDTEGVEAAC